ncbi:MAG: hypothetical protein IKU65_06270, partial [Oscillospiraceae bacterium]|nr:hypothetical protein [Oscillospiraceae bacterium]
MKAYDIYKRTCAIMFEREGEDKNFSEKFCPILSALLAESLMYENSVRLSLGKEKLLFAPVVSDMEDEIDFSDEIMSIALPYGVAAYFYEDDGESYNAMMYRERFINALTEAAKCN